MKTNRMFLLSLPILLFVLVSGAQGQTTAGDEFQVNTNTTLVQSEPSVSSDAEGNFVVVWTDDQYQYGYGGVATVVGRRYDKDGNPLSGEFQINTATDDAYSPDVALDNAGDFVVVWTRIRGVNYEEISAQRFQSNGTPLGTEFSIAASVNHELEPAVDSDATGNFVVVWTQTPTDLSDAFIRGRRLASDGSSLGVFGTTSGLFVPFGVGPDVAVDSDGDFVVVWTAYYDSEVGAYGPYIYGKQFNSSGQPAAGLVDLGAGDNPAYGDQAAVDMDDQGNFVVVWTDYYSTYGDILGQRFNSAGVPQADPVVVNTNTAYSQTNPNVSMDANGNFVVTWTTPDDTDYAIAAQRFAPDGTAMGGEFQVNTNPSSEYNPLYTLETASAVSMTSASNFVVTWASYGPDGDDFGVFGQRYAESLLDEVVADFGTTGLYHYQTEWLQMSSFDPEDLETWEDKLAVDLGASQGLFLVDSVGWTHLSSMDPSLLTAWGDKLAIGFTGLGVFIYDGTWTHLTTWDPLKVVAWGDKLIFDFGPGQGVYYYDGTWFHLTTWDPYLIVPWGDTLVFAFDSGRGIYSYDGTWAHLSTWEPEDVVAWGDKLAIDFGASGLFTYNTSAGWFWVSTSDPQQLEAWGTKLVVALPSGLYSYETATGFSSLSSWIPIHIAALQQMLVLDFGPVNGIYTYDDGSWASISPWSSESLVPVDIYE